MDHRGRARAARTHRWDVPLTGSERGIEFRLEVTSLEGHTVVAAYGELDVASAPQLRDTVLELCAVAAPRIVIDLSGLQFLDSVGLGVLVGFHKRVRSVDGVFAVVSGNRRIRPVFELTGLAQVIPLYDTVDEVVRRPQA